MWRSYDLVGLLAHSHLFQCLLPSILMTHLQPMVKVLVAVTALLWAAELLLIRFGG